MASRKETAKKRPLKPVSRTADYPGQALNVDLLFVPASHAVDVKLLAVSGSSGRLVVERIDEAKAEPDYSGKVFGNPDLKYVEASPPIARVGCRERKPEEASEEPPKLAEVRRLRQKIATEREKRRQVRQICVMEDAAWAQQRQKKSIDKTSVLPGVRVKNRLNANEPCANNVASNWPCANRKTSNGVHKDNNCARR